MSSEGIRAFADWRAQLARSLAPVKQVHIQIDTARVLRRSRLTRLATKNLLGVAKGLVILSPSRSLSHPNAVHIQRPTVPALEAALAGDPLALITRVDVACDFTCLRDADLQELESALRKFVTQPWHRDRRERFVERTVYLAHAATSRNIVLYSDRPSKIDGRPAVHLEVRLKGAGTLRRYGLADVDGIQKADWLAILRRNVRLSYLPRCRLERLVHQMAARSLMDQPGPGSWGDNREERAAWVKQILRRSLRDWNQRGIVTQFWG